MRCVGSSGDLLPPLPPAEKATANQDKAWKSGANEGTRNGDIHERPEVVSCSARRKAIYRRNIRRISKKVPPTGIGARKVVQPEYGLRVNWNGFDREHFTDNRCGWPGKERRCDLRVNEYTA